MLIIIEHCRIFLYWDIWKTKCQLRSPYPWDVFNGSIPLFYILWEARGPSEVFDHSGHGTLLGTVGSHTSTPWVNNLPRVSVPTIVLMVLLCTDPNVELIPFMWIPHPKTTVLQNIAGSAWEGLRVGVLTPTYTLPSSSPSSLLPGPLRPRLPSFTDIIYLPLLSLGLLINSPPSKPEHGIFVGTIRPVCPHPVCGKSIWTRPSFLKSTFGLCGWAHSQFSSLLLYFLSWLISFYLFNISVAKLD